MPTISYAQNYEDIMLHRALRDVPTGFYVDVGANLPDAESVTKLFYDLGWHGINIEPVKDVYDQLAAARPRDVNLNIAAWSATGSAPFFTIDGSDAFATLEPGMVQVHKQAGRGSEEHRIETRTLTDILAQHAPGQDIHFLKIDVEGGEIHVLRGLDLALWRPWIILTESHGPDPLVNYYQPGEDHLLAANYRFAYADGLNRFYLAGEHWDRLSPKFLMPANVYDNFIRASEHAAAERALRAEAAWRGLNQQVTGLQQQASRLQQENADLHAQLISQESRNKSSSGLGSQLLSRFRRSASTTHN